MRSHAGIAPSDRPRSQPPTTTNTQQHKIATPTLNMKNPTAARTPTTTPTTTTPAHTTAIDLGRGRRAAPQEPPDTVKGTVPRNNRTLRNTLTCDKACHDAAFTWH